MRILVLLFLLMTGPASAQRVGGVAQYGSSEYWDDVSTLWHRALLVGAICAGLFIFFTFRNAIARPTGSFGRRILGGLWRAPVKLYSLLKTIIRVSNLRDVPPYPSVAQFEQDLHTTYLERAGDTILIPEYLSAIIAMMGTVYTTDFRPPKQYSLGQSPLAAYTAFGNACADCLLAFTQTIPSVVKQPLASGQSLLTEKQTLDGCFFIDGKLDNRVSSALILMREVWLDANLKEYFPNRYNENDGSQIPVRQYSDDPKEDRRYARDFEKEWKEYERDAVKRSNEIPITQQLLVGTPFYYRADAFLPRGERQLPFVISAEQRYRHQFVVGATGSGKTTFLSAQIAEDLLRVARNEASLFIMDSKNQLIPDIAKLDLFSDDGPLGNRLSYIEPNPEFPIALNIFEISDAANLREERQAQQSALQLITFFLDSILQMDATGHQETVLRYAIPAVLAVPNPTLLTLHRLLSDGGYEELEPHFRHLRQAEWLKLNLGAKGNFNISRNALRGRIEAILSDDTFYEIFCKPESTINLLEQLNQPRVVLVNTLKGELPLTAGPLGRLFIAKLLQFTEQRTLLKGPKLPVFVYIDEASDYLADNAAVIELLNKARAQNVSFTFAIQGVEDVSPDVLAALRRCNIQVFNGTGVHGRTFDIAMDNQPPVTVTIPGIDFAKEPSMSEASFEALQLRMWKAFSSKAKPTADAGQPNNPPRYDFSGRNSPPPPDDEAPTRPSTTY